MRCSIAIVKHIFKRLLFCALKNGSTSRCKPPRPKSKLKSWQLTRLMNCRYRVCKIVASHEISPGNEWMVPQRMNVTVFLPRLLSMPITVLASRFASLKSFFHRTPTRTKTQLLVLIASEIHSSLDNSFVLLENVIETPLSSQVCISNAHETIPATRVECRLAS